jgi:hypothetical protein
MELWSLNPGGKPCLSKVKFIGAAAYMIVMVEMDKVA